MAREIQITPRRMKYAQDVELKLCNTLMKIASEKQEEISKIIQVTLQQMKANTNQVLEDFNYNGKQYKLYKYWDNYGRLSKLVKFVEKANFR